MALISGIYDCSEIKFLFAPRKGADCIKKKLCQATRMKDFGHNRTLCLVNTVYMSRLSLSEIHSGGEATGDLMSSCLAGCLRCKCDLILFLTGAGSAQRCLWAVVLALLVLTLGST